MPTHLFFELAESKREKIIESGIAEFARCGYTGSSTNRMVKSCGISKGSLFKYFENKEELFFYLLDHVTAELTADLAQSAASLPSELFRRVVAYSELEFSWYIRHPEKYKLIVNAFTKSDTDIYLKTESRYGLTELQIYNQLMENIDISQLRWDKQKTIDVIKWFLLGFNKDFIGKLDWNGCTPPERLKNEYVKKLSEHLELLKTGLFK